MSATDIEIELNEFEKSDSTLQNTASFDNQEMSHVNVKTQNQKQLENLK